MKKITLVVGLLVLIFGVSGDLLTSSVMAQNKKRTKGYLYGVFEVEADKDLSNRMIKAGFQILSSKKLNKIGLAEEIKTGYRYFYVPFQNMIVEVRQNKARTIWNGSFTLYGVDLSSEKWSIKTTIGEESFSDEHLRIIKTKNVYQLYLFFSSEDMERGMHFHFGAEKKEGGNQYKHINNCTHCNLYPDCAIALAIGIKWCRDEHRYNLPLHDPRRFCNGEPKSYLNGEGYNCSYFFGWRQCR